MYMHNTSALGRAVSSVLWAMKKLPQKTSMREKEKTYEVAKKIGEFVDVKRVKAGCPDVKCVWYIPDGAPIDRAVLYLHGGAYVAGRTTMDYSAAYTAKRLKMRLLLVDYRLAPENPYPCALNDAVNAYNWLTTQGAPASNISVLGDSAGGGLAAALMMKLRDDEKELPASLVLLSPWVDLRCNSVTYNGFTRDPVLGSSLLLRSALQYSRSYKRSDPYLSPALGCVRGFPPTLVICGTREVLLNDSVTMANKLKSAGVENELHIWKGMFHNFPITGWLLRETKDAMELSRQFIIDRVGQPAQKGK